MPAYDIPADLQIYGGAIAFMLEGAERAPALRASRIFSEEGVGKLDADGIIRIDSTTWYQALPMIRAHEQIGRELGAEFLVRAGSSIPVHASFPAGIRTPEGALRSIHLAYYMNHGVNGEALLDAARGTFRRNIGGYHSKRDGDRRVLMECENPYPCDFDRGIVIGAARLFEPQAVLTHGSSCRSHGAKLCAYSVAW